MSDPAAFQWQSQLRARWDDPSAKLKIADAQFDYNYEYLGNGSRLVVTPLTDRIYVTASEYLLFRFFYQSCCFHLNVSVYVDSFAIFSTVFSTLYFPHFSTLLFSTFIFHFLFNTAAQALHLNMGCAPAGPAGTGKTETTKDLACALGKLIYVINCSPEMDYMSMGNIFKGLAASGGWGCFDEFNRLKSEVLSVCTVQFKAVCDGKTLLVAFGRLLVAFGRLLVAFGRFWSLVGRCRFFD